MNAMTRVALRNLAAHRVRLALTVVSVLLGTAFVAGSFVFTDTLRHSFDTIFATSDKGVDTRVQPAHSYDPGVPAALVRRIAAVPGAATVVPQVSGPVVLVDARGHKIDSHGAPSVGANWSARSVNAVPTFVSGHAPESAGQVVINDSAARNHHLAVGDRVKVVVANAQVVDATISGVYAVPFDTGGYIGALFTAPEAMRLFGDGSRYSSVDIAAAPGVPEQALTARIARILPAGLEARTGTQVRDAETRDVASALSFVTYLLLGFGVIALLVGTFIIYNTFAMLVAQRQRELALLRAIGAGRRQVRRSVALEAGVIGVLGSALGLAGGIGLAFGLHALLGALKVGLPSGGLVLSPRTVVITLLLGTAVTVVAGYPPARRAARIPPVAAMREEFAAPSAAGMRRRVIAGAVVAALAALATGAGAATGSAGPAASLTGLGLLGMCAAAMLLSPVLARWIIEPLGRLVGRPFGAVGRLARTNAVRNPRRTAATAFALTLGLVLVSGIAVLGSSVTSSLSGIVDSQVRADYILTTDGRLQVPAPAAAAVRTVPGVGSTVALQTVGVSIAGTRTQGTSVDGPIRSVLDVTVEKGTVNTAGRAMAISQSTARARHWGVGSTVRLTGANGRSFAERVVGVYADSQLLGPWLVSGELYRAVTPREQWADDVVLVRAARGADLTALRAGLDRATNGYYVVQVQDREQFKGRIAGQVNGLIGLLYGLLGLAVVIAVLGIVNTLALSVVERRREIGMLRAVGMLRRQVRRTVYLESLLIAVFGAVLGLALGLGYGSLITRTLRGQGVDRISVPWAQSAVFLVLAALVGVAAALWPALRAARTRPLAAIAGG